MKRGRQKNPRATRSPWPAGADHRTDGDPRPRRAAFRFLAIFVAVIALFYAITLSSWVERHAILPVMRVSADGVSWLLNLGGARTTVDGVLIRGPDFSVAVKRGCDPIEPIVLLGAALVAFPSPWRFRAGGFLVGATILFALNLVRIATLYLAGRAQVSWFEPLHQEWWPAGFILTAFLIWFGWLRRLQKRSGLDHA
jgi:exosortase/archaeosortase family protein